ncbi:MAG: T9SS C-terminal target domain-containing protein [Bacteroidetes bacterium]|nr:MAG: T9SS C-terminal target domain-containing protein [Bacteroidota bacterium]
MKNKLTLVIFFLISSVYAKAQYAPAAGQPGSTAVYKDSSIIVAWANQATITRGWQNIANQSLGKVTIGDANSPVGAADNNVVSLGDGGSAILQFAKPIMNGTGPDFAVFENAFDDYFLELAFVEVSSDGQRYVRFPAHSLTQTITQVGGFGQLQTVKINNLAGKYKGGYGTPFDLEELKDSTGLDIMHITHIRIIDVVGSIDDAYATRDTANNKINDPFPTPFPSGGFDLDAIAVMNLATDIHNLSSNNQIAIYPNPTENSLTFQCDESGFVEIISINGQILLSHRFTKGKTILNLSSLAKGVYLFRINLSDRILIRRVLKN